MMRSLIRSPQSLGDAVRRARRAAGLTQKELARRSGLRQATVSDLECARGSTIETLFAVMTNLELEFEMRERKVIEMRWDEIF